MLCVDINDKGLLQASPNSLEDCTSYVSMTSSEYLKYQEFSTFDGALAGESFAYGFTLIFFFWSLGYVVSVIRSFLNSAY